MEDFDDSMIEIICNDENKFFKEKIEKLLTLICYGKENIELGSIDLKETIEELNQRISTKTDSQKAGMIGELLFHLKSFEYLQGYTHISVYLNKEERSVKKGFDVLLFKDNQIWYTEVKSKENGNDKDITELHIEKQKEAIADVKNKFSGENKNYWISAKTNIVNIEEYDLKKQIAAILSKEINPNVNKNAISVSTVFRSNMENIKREKIKNIVDNEKTNFNELLAVCITHEDYKKVINLLKEVENGA